MQVFYVNIGGGEPIVRGDFFEFVDYAVERTCRREVLDQRLADHAEAAARIAGTDYLDVQISIDGADASDQRPGPRAGSYATARCGMDHLAKPASGSSRSRS